MQRPERPPALNARQAPPRFQPTAEQREIVQELASLGTRHQDICRFVKRNGSPICVATLTKHFADELAFGRAHANAKVAATLFKMATSGLIPAATFFWLKCRAGWQETPTTVEHTGPNGEPLPMPSLGDFYATVAIVGRAKAEQM